MKKLNNKVENGTPKKIFKEVYFDEFDDPCEEFVDVLYDLIDESIIVNELKKINNIKEKKGKVFLVEKYNKGNKNKEDTNN